MAEVMQQPTNIAMATSLYVIPMVFGTGLGERALFRKPVPGSGIWRAFSAALSGSATTVGFPTVLLIFSGIHGLPQAAGVRELQILQRVPSYRTVAVQEVHSDYWTQWSR